jgi:hypothetical protein
MTKEKFLSKIKKTENDCWEWQGCTDKDGYGRIQMMVKGRREQLAHRVSYILFKGDIPKYEYKGFQIDHLCRNHKCVNPDHLEIVTNKENILRGVSFSAVNVKKTHCIAGHEFTPENTIKRKEGGRNCRTCMYRRRDVWESKNPDYHHNYHINVTKVVRDKNRPTVSIPDAVGLNYRKVL